MKASPWDNGSKKLCPRTQRSGHGRIRLPVINKALWFQVPGFGYQRLSANKILESGKNVSPASQTREESYDILRGFEEFEVLHTTEQCSIPSGRHGRESGHNQNERTNWFCYTVHHDSIGRPWDWICESCLKIDQSDHEHTVWQNQLVVSFLLWHFKSGSHKLSLSELVNFSVFLRFCCCCWTKNIAYDRWSPNQSS